MTDDPKESVIEGKVRKYAIERGLLVYKLSSPGTRSVPDRLFITPTGKVFFCELKRKGKKPTEKQAREHARMRGHNAIVFVVDNFEDGKRMIDLMMGDLPEWLR